MSRRPSPLPALLAGGAAIAAFGGALAVFTAVTSRHVSRALPPEGAFMDVDGGRLHYLDQGSGPAVVLIHGLGGQARHFTHSLVDRLATDHRVIVVERPGSGWSEIAPGASHALRAQARSIADLLRKLELHQPLVVGHSLGGAVSLALALDHPDVVGGLALLAPLTQVVAEASPVFAALAIPSPLVRRVVAWTLAAPLSVARSSKTLETVFGPETAPADFGERGGGMLGLRPRAFMAASADLIAAAEDLPDMVARYDSITVPVGVLYGRDDRLLDAALHGEGLLRQLPAVDLEIVEDAGHMLPITRPELCAAFIRRMAAKLETAA